MADNETKGRQYLAEAEKKLKKSQGFLNGTFRCSLRVDEAIELYVRAGNMFKMAEKWSEAGSAFSEAAWQHLKSGNKHDAGSCYVDAANCYKKGDAQEANDCLFKAIEIYKDMGRFTIAAKHHVTAAGIHETEAPDLERAISHNEQADDYNRGKKFKSAANQCLLAVNEYAEYRRKHSAQFQKTFDNNNNERVSAKSLESIESLKLSIKEQFVRDSLCYMCDNLRDAQLVVKKYEEVFPLIGDSRECKLVKTLLDKIGDNDVEGYTRTVGDYISDSMLNADPRFTNFLVKMVILTRKIASVYF